MRAVIRALSVGIVMTACSRAPSRGAPTTGLSAPVLPLPASSIAAHTEPVVDASASGIESESDWAELIRNGRYKAALLKLRAVPGAQRSAAQMRLAEGLLDLKLADFPAAEIALRGVEAQLPALKQAIALARAQALKAAAASADEYPLGSTALDKAGCLKRAQRYADQGQLARAQAELQLMQSAPGSPPSQLALTLVQAWAQYNARADYAKAAELFTQAAQLDRAQTPKYLFYAARALSRDNQNQEAIARYRDLLKRFPKTREAEEARYLIARLHYSQSEWPQAEQAYSDYLQLYGKKGNRRGRFTGVATYERAVTRLAAGKSGVAAADFSALLKGSEDPYEQAQLMELLGTSLSASNPSQAVRPLQQAIETWPLSLPAALAALRLAALHAPLPSFPSDSSSAPPALSIQLPHDVQLLQRLGFEDLAASGLAAHEQAFSGGYGSRGSEAMCQAFAMLDDARERYRYGRAKVRPAALLSPPKRSNRWAWECLYPRPYQ
ncbi:MAG TPA: tetratricopeptide repeat protein, partial [Polyangiaceae bacterium]|nr:tetratricopeptide repeat protein [Polyangiaceae bacterium]